MAKLSARGRAVVKRYRLEKPQTDKISGKQFVLLREYAVMSDGKVLFKAGGLWPGQAPHWNGWKVASLPAEQVEHLLRIGYQEVWP